LNRIVTASTVLVAILILAACATEPTVTYIPATIDRPRYPPAMYEKIDPSKELPSCAPGDEPCITNETYGKLRRKLGGYRELIESYESLIDTRRSKPVEPVSPVWSWQKLIEGVQN
jgi:hypothetical protein